MRKISREDLERLEKGMMRLEEKVDELLKNHHPTSAYLIVDVLDTEGKELLVLVKDEFGLMANAVSNLAFPNSEVVEKIERSAELGTIYYIKDF